MAFAELNVLLSGIYYGVTQSFNRTFKMLILGVIFGPIWTLLFLGISLGVILTGSKK
jgi:hypothetical protein